MLRRLSPRWLIALTVVVLLTAGCGDANDAAADTTSVATATIEDADAAADGQTVFRFDGSSCEIVGDRSLQAGFNELVFVDTAGEQGDFDVLNLPDGYTAEDAFKVWEETNRTADFVVDLIHTHFAGGEKRVTFNLMPGTWHAVCSTTVHIGRWHAEDTLIVE